MASKSSNKRVRRQIIIGVVGTLILAACVGLATLAQGKVRGTEFSPEDFGEREFDFWEIPLVNLQISPIRRRGSTNPLASYLTAQRLIQTPRPGKQVEVWHLVRMTRGSIPRPPADAEILMNYLDQESGKHWRTWSVDHPKMAKVFWPVIQRLAQRELYVLMPDLFGIAKRAENATQLSTRIDQYLRESYLQIATNLRDADKPFVARELLVEATTDYPEDAELQELLRSLPKPEVLPAEKADEDQPDLREKPAETPTDDSRATGSA